ncbi:Flp pilus assembly protein CpaB [Bradyrhizobium sp. WBOS7]|uniref:Flp pilus assembly protein CpaB n=2 Tax=Nitrobacteraceae TaxID=41294 RepID=A0AAE9NA40_9BRAD|nr:Flp pilus assembly protein CpaB [Bradyrhizobium sp. WBOS2]MDD1570862.1 Flp pilus assembly protein CpaB [Bradyrhizobium sp. WBOS1]MDD1577502.1 Flp pilus assembly protein CpaB [Bradyrhizobium sp. WBOS7]MDD1600447.1 Flp pilus assembly protein CpaB [Bradyrhizobium sp. WBOS16]UUO38965.1 Flp pilus assembly protein CpaB [Bradyrhizobium sp. WBOS01]UUO45149.1 Flp pilus assembly protein CpaB [Bradyrhizobium sp. WBOS02]UUO55773.1 Flp pilus assembly protein CpaB [Bradyrhizobium sp. WBOS07]UUO65763.1 
MKRMNRARIVVLAVAISAGGVAAYLASGSDQTAPPPAPVAQLPTVDVLVAKNDIGLGQTVKPEDVQWQTWPAATASATFIRRNERPEGATQVTGSIARAPFIQGEPIRDQKLVKAEGSGFMAAILPTGMRAISTEISPETGAGGFILPNDRVDVLLTRRLKNPDQNNGAPDIVTSEIILANIRVLAIDQAPKEKDGQNAVVGKTVTLELNPAQTATLSAARQSGTLSLALRSIVDVKMSEITLDDSAQKRDGVSIIRYGIPSQTAKVR